MDLNKEDLRKRYESKETNELVDIFRGGGLTEMAMTVLLQVFEARGISEKVLNGLVEEKKSIEINNFSELVLKELTEGTDKKKIIKELVNKKWEKDNAIRFVDSIEKKLNEYKSTPDGRKVFVSKSINHIKEGLIMVIVGGVSTVFIYNFNSTNSHRALYRLAGIIIILGLIYFFRGLSGWLKYKSMDSELNDRK